MSAEPAWKRQLLFAPEHRDAVIATLARRLHEVNVRYKGAASIDHCWKVIVGQPLGSQLRR